MIHLICIIIIKILYETSYLSSFIFVSISQHRITSHQTQHYERMEGHQSLKGSFDHVIKLSAIEGDPGTVEWEDTSVPSRKYV